MWATATVTGLVGLGTTVVVGGVAGNSAVGQNDRFLHAFDASTDAKPPLLLQIGMDMAAGNSDDFLRVFDAPVEALAGTPSAYPYDESPRDDQDQVDWCVPQVCFAGNGEPPATLDVARSPSIRRATPT